MMIMLNILKMINTLNMLKIQRFFFFSEHDLNFQQMSKIFNEKVLLKG